MAERKLVLGSASPRRQHLLSLHGYDFAIDPAGIDERVEPDEDPFEATARLAVEKAAAVAGRRAEHEVVLTADTSVVCQGQLLGKPRDPRDGERMLALLAGRNHLVITAWALVVVEWLDGYLATGFTTSVVRMRELGWREARAYVASGESDDKAGAYAVQGIGRRLVGAVIGSLDNVIGLPVAQVVPVLDAVGIARAGS